MLLWLMLSMFTACYGKSILVHGSTADNATAPGSLQYYLCARGSAAIEPNSTLYLSSSSNHTILPGHFCLLARLSLLITSDRLDSIAHIVCHDNETTPTTGFGFIQAMDLTLKNLHFSHCGGVIRPAAAVSSINESRIYFPPEQTAVLLFNSCRNILIKNVSISGPYFGYGIIMADTITARLEAVDILDNTDKDKQQCSHHGSGLLIAYFNMNRTISSSTATVLIENVHIINNINCPLNTSSPIQELISNASLSLRVPVFGAGGVTILLVWGAYPRDISLRSAYIRQNSGTPGAGMMVLYVVGRQHSQWTSLTVSESEFAENTLLKHSNGAGLGYYVLLDRSSSMGLVDAAAPMACIVCITRSSFTLNQHTTAQYGGGLYIGTSVSLLSLPISLWQE